MPWPHLGTGTDGETCWMMFLRDPTHIASTFDLFSQPEAINWPLLASEDILHEVIRAESLPQTMKRLVISAFDALRTGYKAAKLSQKSSLSDFEVQRCGDWAEEIGWWSFQWSFQSSCKAIRLYTYIYMYIYSNQNLVLRNSETVQVLIHSSSRTSWISRRIWQKLWKATTQPLQSNSHL